MTGQELYGIDGEYMCIQKNSIPLYDISITNTLAFNSNIAYGSCREWGLPRLNRRTNNKARRQWVERHVREAEQRLMRDKLELSEAIYEDEWADVCPMDEDCWQ